MAADQELEHQLREALNRDNPVAAELLEVSVRDGVATLRGNVKSEQRKISAQEIASSFPGCRSVTNELVVQSAEPVSDEEVANLVRSALRARPDITPESLTSTVQEGVVTLAGTVGTHRERALVEKVTQAVRGVRGVKNQLQVEPVRQMEDEALSRAIRTAMAEEQALKEAHVSVAASGGVVVLSGDVPEQQQKEAAEQIAGRFAHAQVRNEIHVTGG